MSYVAPVKDMLFNIAAPWPALNRSPQMPGFEDAGLDTAQAVLEECAKFNEGVLAPAELGRRQKPIELGKTAWSPPRPVSRRPSSNSPRVAGKACSTRPTSAARACPKPLAPPAAKWSTAANMSFALCPLLTDGAIEALLTAGSDELKATYLDKLVERQVDRHHEPDRAAGGLATWRMVRTRAEPQADGTYKVFGTKIFITCGEHDMAENIVHLVLARVHGAPEGVKGISLFVVPKFMVNDRRFAGRPQRRALRQHRTQDGHQGQPDCRAAVRRPWRRRRLPGGPGKPWPGVHVHHDERRPLWRGRAGHCRLPSAPTRRRCSSARDRVQSRPVDGSITASAPIIHHPDVRRMLMTMRAYTEGCRAMASVARCGLMTRRTTIPMPTTRKQNQAFYEFMVPLVKGYSTEMSLEVTSLGVQVHGGMGFIEETGAAQYYRDAKILTIYEGTTAIQANDLVGRKTARDGGQIAKAIAAQMEATEADLLASGTAARAGRGQAPEGGTPELSSTWWISWLATPKPAPTPCSPAACLTSCWPAM